MSHHWQSRLQTHLQSGSKRQHCCYSQPAWFHFHCRTSPSSIAHLIPGQRQHPVSPVWHIHTPAPDRAPLLLGYPRSRHRQSATHYCGTLPHGLRTGFCHQQGECQRSLYSRNRADSTINNTINTNHAFPHSLGLSFCNTDA